MLASEQMEGMTFVRPRPARLAVATIFFMNGAVVANWVARIPDVKQRLGLSDGTLGIALLFMALGALVAQPAAGWMIGRVGSRKVTTTMALLLFVVIPWPGFAPNLPTLMLALCLFGACNGALDVAMNAQAAIVEQQYRRPIMASFHGLWSIGGLTGAALGGLAASWRIPVGMHLLGIAAAALVISFIATRRLIMDSGKPAEPGAAFALPPRALVPLGIIAFCVLFCEGAIGDWSAVYLRDHLHSTPGIAALGFAFSSLLMAAGRLTGDELTVRLGPTLLVRGGGALVTLGILLALLGSASAVAIAGFALVGAGVSCIFPLVLSAASRTPGVAPGTAIAAMATVGYTGFLVGPPLIGSLADVTSLRLALGLLGLFGALIVVLGPAIRREDPV